MCCSPLDWANVTGISLLKRHASQKYNSGEPGVEDTVDVQSSMEKVGEVSKMDLNIRDILDLSKDDLLELCLRQGMQVSTVTKKADLQLQILNHTGLVKTESQQQDLGSNPVMSATHEPDEGLKTFQGQLRSIVALLPYFNDVNDEGVDTFFRSFERIALDFDWPKKYWSYIIHNRLKGRALSTFLALPEVESRDYEKAKHAILVAYSRSPEYYRQIFRNDSKGVKDTYIEFERKKRTQLELWLKSAKVSDFEGLKELLLMENFCLLVPESEKRKVFPTASRKIHDLAEALDDMTLDRQRWTHSPSPREHPQWKPAGKIPYQSANTYGGPQQHRGHGQAGDQPYGRPSDRGLSETGQGRHGSSNKGFVDNRRDKYPFNYANTPRVGDVGFGPGHNSFNGFQRRK